MIFDDIPEVYNGRVGANAKRLTKRHKGIIDQIDFTDKTVLDLGSHDGRWSLAAKAAGAKSVTGVEIDAEHVANANYLLSKYNITGIEYIHADIFDALPHLHTYDIILCCGVLYHTHQHWELLTWMFSASKETLIIDTDIWRTNDPIIYWKPETSQWKGNGVANISKQIQIDTGIGRRHGDIIVGIPSLPYLSMMLDAHDMKYQQVDYKTMVDDYEYIFDYIDGRVTLICQHQ